MENSQIRSESEIEKELLKELKPYVRFTQGDLVFLKSDIKREILYHVHGVNVFDTDFDYSLIGHAIHKKAKQFTMNCRDAVLVPASEADIKKILTENQNKKRKP